MADAVRTDAKQWRPQPFGRRRARDVPNPLIEPLWSGVRVLAEVPVGGAVTFRDRDGEPVRNAAVERALADAVRADHLVLDGYLTTDVGSTGEGVMAEPGVPAPTPGMVTRQLLLGERQGGGRRLKERLNQAQTVRLDDDDLLPIAFVAVDLLELDGDELLDVPLLERKRLLESVLVEEARVRLGVYVQPPIAPWLPTWRAIGIRELAFKASNSRYTPGRPNDGWATIAIPSR